MRLKLIVFVVLMFQVFAVFGQEKLYISTSRIGPFSLLMKKADVDKLLNDTLNVVIPENSYSATVDVAFADAQFSLLFCAMSDDQVSDSLTVCAVSTRDARIKTVSGLGVGSSQADLLNAYSNKYDFCLSSDFEYSSVVNEYVRTLGKRTFTLLDNVHFNELHFLLLNGKVAEIKVLTNQGN